MILKNKILITTSLVYANGPLHLGHLLEQIQGDILARFYRLLNQHEIIFLSGSDAHGTAIMLQAEKFNLNPEQFINNIQQEQLKDSREFNISFDYFDTTHSEINYQLTLEFYEAAKKFNLIFIKDIEQFYDATRQIFLPDRFIKGECPHCAAKDQYGDGCEQCGVTYTPNDLHHPYSVLSNQQPILKISQHLFFNLPALQEILFKIINQDNFLDDSIRYKLHEWFNQPLKPWDISRDKPFFGFEIPPQDNKNNNINNKKYFYGWWDAPIGYLSILNNIENINNYWIKNIKNNNKNNTQIIHIIGKDIIYFHALFWPAMLYHTRFKLPDRLQVHGFLTLNKQKLSKSRGNFITVREYLNHLDPDYLRYYFATKLTIKCEDIDLDLEDFRQRVNSDLVGKLINIASRVAKLFENYFNDQLINNINNTLYLTLLKKIMNAQSDIINYYKNFNYSAVTRLVMNFADEINLLITEKAPWNLVKTDYFKTDAHQLCTIAILGFEQLIRYLKPIIPNLATRAEAFLNRDKDNILNFDQHNPENSFDFIINNLKNRKNLNRFQPLLTRITEETIKNLLILK